MLHSIEVETGHIRKIMIEELSTRGGILFHSSDDTEEKVYLG
jgi:hypothetical protein